MRYWITILFLFIFCSNIFSQQSPKRFYLDPYNPEYADSVILVKFKQETGATSLKKASVSQVFQVIKNRLRVLEVEPVFPNARAPQIRLFKGPAGKEHKVRDLRTVYKIRYGDAVDPKKAAKEIEKLDGVEYAEPDYYFYTMGWLYDENTIQSSGSFSKPANTYPDDPLYQSGDQWYIDAVNAPAAWDSTTGDTSQIIGIIDTGVDWHHPDLDDNIWVNWAELNGISGVDDDNNGYVDDIRGWDFVNNDNDPMDDNSHGTHVAGIAAAESNNGVGIAGIAWNARVMPVKVLQSSGRGNASDLAAGINYAAQNGATVINMSLGSYAESQTVKIALENAYAYAILVAAAGNDKFPIEGKPVAFPMFPACYSFVLGVQASNQVGKLTLFSNYDPSGPVEINNEFNHNYEILAPGVSIMSCVPNGGYKKFNGTSMASPIVSGAVALIKSTIPQISNEEIFVRLIQGSNGINIMQSLILQPVPDLHFVSYTITDTLPGDDNDGRVDAGETIQLYINIKNAGGKADSVWTKLKFGEFEDTTTANIIKSTSYIGDMSAYATLTGEPDPFKIQISPNVVNDRDIVFEVLIGCSGSNDTVKQEIIVHVENGEELAGVMDTTLVLTSDKLWLVLQSFRVGANGKLIIKPGVTLKIGGGVYIDVKGQVIAKGTADSVITFTSTNGTGAGFFRNTVPMVPDTFVYCHFKYLGNPLGKPGDTWDQGVFYVDHCLFEEITPAPQVNTSTLISGVKELRHSIVRNINGNTPFSTNYGQIIENNVFFNLRNVEWAFRSNLDGVSVKFNNFVYNSNNQTWGGSNPDYAAVFKITTNNPDFLYNNIINNDRFLSSSGTQDIINLPNQYWGMSTGGYEEQLWDFWDNSSLPMFDINPVLEIPNSRAHGIVWKVEINGINPHEEHLDPIGSGVCRFEVYFNRPMDTTYTPFLTFGVREPYTQHIVRDSARWSPDSTVWTAYYTVGLETGDGIQTIRVANARDNEGFEIPIENQRFKFVIQAAGAAATEFIATPGIGKVDLAWPVANTPDILGYNIYRFQKLTDSTYTDTVMINSQLILDSTYTDFDVIPDTTYYYLYTVVGTDMKESDFSKSVAAMPYNASPGDANGDLTINVLDITTIVSYLLNQNPQPFIFDAADVKKDGEINVLDIVTVINIVMGGQMQKIAASNDQEESMILSPNYVRLENVSNISALRLVVVGKNLSRNDVKPGNLLKRMEYAFHVNNDTLYLVVYNLKNEGFANDAGELFKLSRGEIENVLDIQAADRTGHFVNVETVGTATLIPKDYMLFQNYPNPFNPITTIKYGLPEQQDVKIEIFNILGQKIRTFEVKNQPAGYHQLLWDGKNDDNVQVATGLYIYRLKAGRFVDSKKMLLIR